MMNSEIVRITRGIFASILFILSNRLRNKVGLFEGLFSDSSRSKEIKVIVLS